MTLQQIPIENFLIKPFHLWDVQWLLLTSGDYTKKHYNSMTIGWGSIGYIWRKPFIQVLVRPVRYTYEFMENHDSFTVCAFPSRYHEALQILGNRSGRDGDKIADSNLSLCASTQIAAPAYKEAELIIECQKIYWDDLDPDKFLDTGINDHYPKKDYHRLYFGEILVILGTELFKA